MNIIKTSFFYKTIQYIDQIHEYSFIYKTRRKERIHRDKKFNQSFYKYSRIYKVLDTLGNVCNALFHSINKVCGSSIIINSIGNVTSDMKYKKLKVFNQFTVSFIMGYLITNSVFNMFASYKFKYVVVFALLTLFLNVMVHLVSKYKESSLLVWLISKAME